MSELVKSITKRQFDAYCYARAPFIRYGWEEIYYYESFNRKLLSSVVLNLTDMDFGFVILGRDKRKMFRAIEVSQEFYKSRQVAASELEKAIIKYEYDGLLIYEQGDEQKPTYEILSPKAAVEKLHVYFKALISEERFEAARNLINEIVHTYVDLDGNYIKSFQTTGFDARLWELYLYVFLHSSGFKIDTKYQAPDYCVSYFDMELTIEAVTVNSNPEFDEKKGPESLKETHELSLDYMPIKFGSSLYSKLKKKYWEQDHVKNRPFIIAIHDYHLPAAGGIPGSMTWSRSALIDYLYGYRMKVTVTEDGKLTQHVIDTGTGIKPVLEKIDTHIWKGKTIPSGFFSLPDSENVSAVLFSNNATITTFNRMGKLAGLGSANYKMMRTAQMYDPNPYSGTPIIKLLDVDDPGYEEGWADGLTMYHNPDAKHPVDPNSFPDISHMFFDKGKNELYGHFQPYAVMASVTLVSKVLNKL